jgi:hypothetical protein
MMKISFTLITRTNGPLSKTIKPDGKGGIIKTPAANMTRGTMQRVVMPFLDFGPYLRTLKANQAIAHGVPVNHQGDDDQKFNIGLTGKEIPPYQLSRSKKHLAYPQDTACLAMFDHDPKPGQKSLSPEEFIDIIIKEVPDFAKLPTWHTPSTSSCISDLEGKQLTGEGNGFHLYFPFENSADLIPFADTLFKRLWLAGHGYIFISRAGSMLERTIFDAAVFSPERLDFVSGANCRDCKQRLPDPVFRIGQEVIDA